MNKGIIIIFLAFLFGSCSGQNCKTLPDSYATYLKALKQVRNSSFIISEKMQTEKSSWIENAQFYSCDRIVGFMIVKTKNREYIHQNLPVVIWNKFKIAESFGSFYNNHIKNKYQLKLRQ
jgi:hypothetical protein